MSNLHACRSQWPRGPRRGPATSRFLGLRVRIPPGACMSVCCEYCVLSSRELCVRGVQRSPTERGVSQYNHEASKMSRPWPNEGTIKKSSWFWSSSNILQFIISFLKFQFSSHQPISVADFSWMVNHVKCLIPYLQDPCVLTFLSVEWLQPDSPSLGSEHEEVYPL